MKLTYALFFVLLICSCNSTKKSTNNNKPERYKDIKAKTDSLILVLSIPVSIVSSDEVFQLAIRKALKDSLKERGFNLIEKKEAERLFSEFFLELNGAGDVKKTQEIAKHVVKDKEYLIKEAERKMPYLQRISFNYCENAGQKCFIIFRKNEHHRRSRSWVYEYNDDSDLKKLINRIIETLTQ